MTRIAFLTAACMIAADDGSRRDDAWEHELEFEGLRAACAERAIELRELVWDDPQLAVEEWDAFVIGTTWDYHERAEAFVERLAEIEAKRPLWNGLELVRWNLDKRYLRDLEQRGVRIVPTLWETRVDEAAVERACAHFACDEIVAKPCVGRGAWRQARLLRGEALPVRSALPPEGAVMLQPFLRAVESEGELSYLFFDREFSHCARKLPEAGDYRVQAIYGGRERVHDASPAEIDAAHRVLTAVPDPLLYARVDMIRGPDDVMCLIELEVIEPYFYPEQGSRSSELFARALARRAGVPEDVGGVSS